MNEQEKIAASIDLLQHLWPGHDGPAHIVLADFNVRDGDMAWCIAEIDRGETYTDDVTRPAGHPVYAATKGVLQHLAEISAAEREKWSEDPYATLYEWR